MKNLPQLLPFILLLLLLPFSINAKENHVDRSEAYLEMKWKHVATRMPAEWYATEDAKRCAENVLITQKSIGGWAKNKPYHHLLSNKEKNSYIKSKDKIGATIDNRATTSEIRFLGKVYSHFKEERYKAAFLKGINYLLEAQYENGGWPQFYPLKGGYANHITYNDNAMVDAMLVLNDIYSNSKEFDAFQIDNSLKEKARVAFDKGVECILKTQIIVDGKRTVWCAQHDEFTFLPAKARSYELISFSGAESAAIVSLLMNIKAPSNDVKRAINGAITWFDTYKLMGIRVASETDKLGRKNRIVVKDASASPIWARFYDLKTFKPYFCDRDGLKKDKLSAIGYERRNGYSWYTYNPQQVLDAYEQWKIEN